MGFDQLAAYRERHTIRPVRHDGRDWLPVCAHDRLRLIPRRGGWLHDPVAVRRLAEAHAATAWPGR